VDPVQVATEPAALAASHRPEPEVLLDRELREDPAALGDKRDAGAGRMTLTLDNVDVRYGGVHAVRGLSLTVAPGEIVGLIGPNGAGKSSTLHAIMGLAPASGSVRLGDRELLGLRPEDVARSGVALVPEGRRIFAELSVAENLRLGRAGRRGSRSTFDWVYELFPIVQEFRSRQAGLLSGGQQQQLAIARALVAEPEVLILDEPSLGLAPSVVDVVFDALVAIRERGLAVLLVEQRAQRTVATADRSHVLANGELQLTLGPQDAGDTEKLVAAYLS
ncbi:MAG: ABC transporter ATP-binding protein, partial [Gaiellaceae bacterium]